MTAPWLSFKDRSLTVAWRVTLPGEDPEDERAARYLVTDPGLPPDPVSTVNRVRPPFRAGAVLVAGHKWFGAEGTGTLVPRAVSAADAVSGRFGPEELWAAGAPLWAGTWTRMTEGPDGPEAIWSGACFYALGPEALYARAVELAEEAGETCPFSPPAANDYLEASGPDAPHASTRTRVHARRPLPGWSPTVPAGWEVEVCLAHPEGRPSLPARRYYPTARCDAAWPGPLSVVVEFRSGLSWHLPIRARMTPPDRGCTPANPPGLHLRTVRGGSSHGHRDGARAREGAP